MYIYCVCVCVLCVCCVCVVCVCIYIYTVYRKVGDGRFALWYDSIGSCDAGLVHAEPQCNACYICTSELPMMSYHSAKRLRLCMYVCM